MMLHCKYPIHRQARGQDMPTIMGGIALSLDLSRAFDMVERTLLFQYLETMGVSSNLIQLIANIYYGSEYCFEHRGEARRFPTRRGIRQGCRGAPYTYGRHSQQDFSNLFPCTLIGSGSIGH